MEQLKNTVKKSKDLDMYLPQNESEWIETKCFQIEDIEVSGRSIHCAFSSGPEKSHLVTMVGGIPRDENRRKNLPLINKLYGHLAIKLLKVRESSVMYNQTATGGSGGDWNKETISTRINVVETVSRYFSKKIQSDNLSIIGTSAGAYMAVRSVDSLNKDNFFVKKLVLISPGFYPSSVENIPYGNEFKKQISSPWDIQSSPIFSTLQAFVENGGEVLITFFESDDPPIPVYMQKYCKEFAETLSENGGKIEVMIIPGVAHNFRTIGSQESKNAVDNQSIRDTASKILSFLSREK